MEEKYIKLIFGLKMKQARSKRHLSLADVARLTGMSKSYLNEIEKGKKFPKRDKVLSLAEHLKIPYDQLVSLKLDKKLAPVGELLQSNVLKDIPLDIFGVKESDLIDIVANAPTKVNAFIATIIKIAKHYNFGKENFYLAALRTYQETNMNHFEDLEKAAIDLSKHHQIDLDHSVNSAFLEKILVQDYGYTIDMEGLRHHGHFDNLRSIYIPESKRLLLGPHIDEAQRTFIFAKELAYNWLKIEERLYTFTWIKFSSFDEVLNNLFASYLAGAIIIPRASFKRQLDKFLSQKRFNRAYLAQINKFYNASPESLYQRLTNLLPEDYKVEHLFFLRFQHKKASQNFSITKELHLNQQHTPQGNGQNETYCRRWVSIRVLQQIASQEDINHIMDVQISYYPADEVSYLIFSSATPDPFKKHWYRSVGVGLRINDQLRKVVGFLDDPNIKTLDVGVTCERCNIANCNLRAAAPTKLQAEERNLEIESLVEKLHGKYSS